MASHYWTEKELNELNKRELSRMVKESKKVIKFHQSLIKTLQKDLDKPNQKK